MLYFTQGKGVSRAEQRISRFCNSILHAVSLSIIQWAIGIGAYLSPDRCISVGPTIRQPHSKSAWWNMRACSKLNPFKTDLSPADPKAECYCGHKLFWCRSSSQPRPLTVPQFHTDARTQVPPCCWLSLLAFSLSFDLRIARVSHGSRGTGTYVFCGTASISLCRRG